MVDKRVEVCLLPLAGQQSDVRLRFAQLGTGSWYYRVDQLGFDEGPALASAPAAQQAKFNTPTVSGNLVTISWTGTGTLQEATPVAGPWTDSASQASPRTVPATGTQFFRVKQ